MKATINKDSVLMTVILPVLRESGAKRVHYYIHTNENGVHELVTVFRRKDGVRIVIHSRRGEVHRMYKEIQDTGTFAELMQNVLGDSL